jgi:hypothetical protein
MGPARDVTAAIAIPSAAKQSRGIPPRHEMAQRKVSPSLSMTVL